MIVDMLKNVAGYRPLHPLLGAALDWLASTDLARHELGRFELDSDRLIAMLQEYETRPHEAAVWESHRKYWDLQIVVSGVERMGYAPLGTLPVKSAYDAEKDVAFYDPPATVTPESGCEQITVSAGMFAIFSPQDIHSPQRMAGKPAAVRKLVMKLLCWKCESLTGTD